MAVYTEGDRLITLGLLSEAHPLADGHALCTFGYGRGLGLALRPPMSAVELAQWLLTATVTRHQYLAGVSVRHQYLTATEA